MKIPYEFEQFVGCIYPEDDRHESVSLESLAAAALADSASHDRRPLLAFLNELLDGGHSDAELEHVWLKQSPRSSFSPPPGLLRRNPPPDHRRREPQAGVSAAQQVARMSAAICGETSEPRMSPSRARI